MSSALNGNSTFDYFSFLFAFASFHLFVYFCQLNSSTCTRNRGILFLVDGRSISELKSIDRKISIIFDLFFRLLCPTHAPVPIELKYHCASNRRH